MGRSAVGMITVFVANMGLDVDSQKEDIPRSNDFVLSLVVTGFIM